jgi:uncharacterized protein YndB with AHSA1/START domain
MTIDTSLDVTDVVLSEAPLGGVVVADEAVTLTFRRRYDRPIGKVWAAITTPERLADWFAAVEMELKVGGAIRIDWNRGMHTMEGRIVACDPPRALAWSWRLDGRETLVRFDLETDGEGCTLTLTHSGLALNGPQASGVRAGWHAHLEGLPDAIDGQATSWAVKQARETALAAAYSARSD